MAFVFRSDRSFNLPQQSYSLQNESSEFADVNKCKEQNFVPFNSQANRFEKSNHEKNDYARNVGPCSYANNRSTFLKKSFSSKGIDSLNKINQTMITLIHKAKREYDEKQQQLSQKFKVDYYKESSSKKINNSNNSNSIKVNNSLDSDQSLTMKPKQIIQLVDTTNTSNRICSIPSKNNNFGYDIDESNKQLMLNEDPNKAIKYSGLYNDSVSPNHYFIEKIRKPKGIDWSRSGIKIITNDYNNNNSNNTIQNKNTDMINQSSSTNELTINLRNKNNCNNSLGYSNSMNSISLKKPIIKSNRIVNKIHEEKDLLNEISPVPGPGYYFDENAKYSFRKDSYNIGTFPKAKRKTLISDQDINPVVGPSSYQNNNHTIKKPNFYPLLRKESNILASTSIQSNPYLGPGSYIIDKKIHHKPTSKYYGSLDRRFPLKSITEQSNLGPGEYLDLEHWGKKEFIPPLYSTEKDLYDNHLPGIGSYNVSILNSIDYKIKNKENKLQSKRAPFNIAEKRFHISHSTYNIVGPGPGCYIQPKQWGKEEKIKPISNLEQCKSDNEKNSDSNDNNIMSIPGPGSYDNDIQQWNKKSFNVLFV